MSRFTILFAGAILPSVCMYLVSARADEAVPANDLTVQILADDLYKPGYKEFLATRERLRTIAAEGPKEQAEKATAVLNEYAKKADRWLLEVGNTNEWQRSKADELPLGQGRIGGAPVLLVQAKKETVSRDFAYLNSYGPAMSVAMTGEALTDVHLRYLAGFDSLEVLDISDTNISGSFLAKIEFPKLKILHLANSPVRDDSLPFDVLRRLSTADFIGTLVTNATIRRLSMKEIDAVKVSNTAVDADGIMLLRDANNLMSLSVDVADLTPAAIEMLAAKKSLLRVYLSFDEANADRAAEVAGQFPARIKVSMSEITDEKDYRSRWKRELEEIGSRSRPD